MVDNLPSTMMHMLLLHQSQDMILKSLGGAYMSMVCVYVHRDECVYVYMSGCFCIVPAL